MKIKSLSLILGSAMLLVALTSFFKDRRDSVKVAAYLIYDGGGISSFDILNDHSKALWNTIAGGGDAGKPSNKTKLVLKGNSDSMNIKVKNGADVVINKSLMTIKDSLIFVINDTGCDIVTVEVKKGKKPVYSGRIEFHCGE